MKETKNSEQISHDLHPMLSANFLLAKGFDPAERWFDKRWKQFRVYYKIDGYDCDVLISPSPQVVPNNLNAYGHGVHWMPPEIQVDEFSDIQMLENHHTGDFQVFINSFDNHLTTLSYQYELIEFMKICKCPLIDT